MLDELVKNLVNVKQSFAKNYSGNAHIQEIIPSSVSEKFQLDTKILQQLHNFALKNPIYFNHYEEMKKIFYDIGECKLSTINFYVINQNFLT